MFPKCLLSSRGKKKNSFFVPIKKLCGCHERHEHKTDLQCNPPVRSIILRARLHRGRLGNPPVQKKSLKWSPHLSCSRDQIEMRDYIDGQATPPNSSPTWGPPFPCKQILNVLLPKNTYHT